MSVDALTEDVVFAYGSMAAPGVRFYKSIDDAVPEEATLDALRIRQIIANGVTNALKQTHSGEVRLHVELATMPGGAPGLLFQVIDSGPGLKGRDYRTLFDPLQETDWSTIADASAFAGIGAVLSMPSSAIRKPGREASGKINTRTSDRRRSSFTLPNGADTNLARQGSNFGLPIALQLTLLMKGAIGIAEVQVPVV